MGAVSGAIASSSGSIIRSRTGAGKGPGRAGHVGESPGRVGHVGEGPGRAGHVGESPGRVGHVN